MVNDDDEKVIWSDGTVDVIEAPTRPRALPPPARSAVEEIEGAATDAPEPSPGEPASVSDSLVDLGRSLLGWLLDDDEG